MYAPEENLDSSTPEEVLGPPKYDAMGFFMVFISSLLVGIVAGIIIILFAFLAIGSFSLESGASPILLAFITFIALIIGNSLYYVLLSNIFPNIYSRGKTSLSQIASLSIVIYILFVPIYIIVSGISNQTSTLLIAFSAHVIVNSFSLTILVGIISQYRYSLLVFYSSLISLIITTGVVVLIESQLSQTTSSKALFSLLGLTIVCYVLSNSIASFVSWVYYLIYKNSGYDPIGAIFSKIEEEERQIEKTATETLTKF